MNWIELNSDEKLTEARAASKFNPVILFKHSTTCSISKAALNRLERNWKEEEVAGTKAYYLDLLSHRNISRQIADLFDVEHESPQIILLQNEKSVYTTSHFDIDYSSIKKEIERIAKV